MNEYNEKYELSQLRQSSSNVPEDKEKKSAEEKKMKDLEEKLKDLENNPSSIKMLLVGIDKYIREKNAGS